LLILASQRPSVAWVTIKAAEEVADYLNNRKRAELARLEQEGSMSVQIIGMEGVAPEHLDIECRDNEGRETKFP
jgi:ribonuclease E